MKIIKRSGVEMEFDENKIYNAISKANNNVVESEKISNEEIKKIADEVTEECENIKHSPHVEEIQDLVERIIMKHGYFSLGKNYITYRYNRALLRKENTTDKSVLSLIEYDNEEIKQENSNKNPMIVSVQRDYVAGETSKDIAKRFLVPKYIWDAHERGEIHFHDTDYFVQHMHNCSVINLEDMLNNGTVISNTMIEKPKSFATACNVATQVIAQVASSQYGGQSITLTHLAPFVDISRKKFRRKVEERSIKYNLNYSEESIDNIVSDMVKEEINRGVQMIQYQVITLMTTNGQAPFISVFMYLNEAKDPQTKHDLALIIEEMLKQRILGVKNESGVYITPAFPKLLYVLEEDNIHEDSEYFYLTELAAKCTAKRMVPDYISEKKMLELKIDENGEGHCYPCMGCRSFLTPYVDPETNKPKYYGRFNQGVVTINLPDVALTARSKMENSEVDQKDPEYQKKLEEVFWKIFDERLEICHDALMCRHKRLLGTLSDVAPILWQYGALARLKKGETIDKLLTGGYSTISLGYAGLYECTMAIKGVPHTDPDGMEFGLNVMKKLNDSCTKWKEEHNIGFSVYGTPLESTTYEFAKKLQKRFGIIKGITDKNYITNSYHYHVTQDVDAFTKLSVESKFQELSPGGAISYIEVPDMKGNIPAVISVLQHIYNNIMYAELNSKSDYCSVCGFDGEIQIKTDEESGKLVWECPNCGNRDQNKMSVARRTCGYIGTQFWNQGRTQEIKDRKLHL